MLASAPPSVVWFKRDLHSVDHSPCTLLVVRIGRVDDVLAGQALRPTVQLEFDL